MPKLHSANTTAWGLVSCGKLVDTVVVHSDNPSWRDTGFLLYYGCLSTSIVVGTVSRRSLSKTYPQKSLKGGDGTAVRDQRQHLRHRSVPYAASIKRGAGPHAERLATNVTAIAMLL